MVLPERAPDTQAPHEKSALSGNPDRLIAISLFLITFLVYAATMCRTIYTGDDGDFITAMATGGVAHPTGYPLFTLLGRLFLWIIPFGEPALRINLMTTLSGAGAVAMLYRFLALLVPGRLWAVLGALLFAFAPTMWQQSLSCEVYSLNCFFLTTLLWLSLRWRIAPENTAVLRTMAFVYGLSLTHHLTMALMLPGFLVLVLVTRPTLLYRDIKVLGSLVPLFLLPLVLYAYLPLAATLNRNTDAILWGGTYTWPAFWAHITGAQYRDAMFSGYPLFAEQFGQYWKELLPGEFGLGVLWLAPIGLYTLLAFRKSNTTDETEKSDNTPPVDTRPHTLLLLYIFMVNVAYSSNYAIFDVYVYYLPSYVVAATLMAAGASSLTRWFWGRFVPDPEVRTKQTQLGTPILLAAMLVHTSLHWAPSDKSGNYLETDLGANLLASAPPRAILLVKGPTALSLWYHQFVLKERTDVVAINTNLFPGMFFGNAWYYEHLAKRYPDMSSFLPQGMVEASKFNSGEVLAGVLRGALAQGRPVVAALDLDMRRLADLRTKRKPVDKKPDKKHEIIFEDNVDLWFDTAPWGLCERLYPKGKAPDSASLLPDNARLWQSYRVRGVYTGWAHNDVLQEPIARRYADAGTAFGQLAEEVGNYELAELAYAQALKLYQIPEAEAGQKRSAAAMAAAGKGPAAAPPVDGRNP